MRNKILILTALVLYFLPLWFKAWIFFVENIMYALMLLPLSYFIAEPYKKWFRYAGGAMLAIGGIGFIFILL